jgi:hypothetical protein
MGRELHLLEEKQLKKIALMLKLLTITAGLALGILSIQADAQPHKTQQASKSVKPPSPVAPVAPQETDLPSLQSKQHEHVDADVRVVSTPAKDGYDKAVVWINSALALIGTLGIVTALITLRKLERQTKATEDAVLEAKVSRTLAEDTAKRQLRAYFGTAEGKLYIRDDGSVEPRVTLTNCGQTPAYDLQVTEYGRFETYPFKRVPRPGQNRLRPHTHIVGGGQPYYFTCRSVPSYKGKDSLLLDLQSDGFAFILNGWCTYTDIFKDGHHVDFQLIIGGGTALQKTIDHTGEWLGFFTDSVGNSSD